MRFSQLLIVLLATSLVSGCACRKAAGGRGDGNIPVAEGESILKDVNFAFDSYGLDAAAKEKLALNADWLKANSSSRVQIEGHCDERGTNEYNMVLGMNRAKASMDYLNSLGVANDRMGVVSYGEEIPLDPAHNEAAWSRNRRAHFKLLN